LLQSDSDTTSFSSPPKAPPQRRRRPPRPAVLDLVYGWVNGSDPEWNYSKHYYVQQEPVLHRIKPTSSMPTPAAPTTPKATMIRPRAGWRIDFETTTNFCIPFGRRLCLGTRLCARS
jgi:hypothetical protein